MMAVPRNALVIRTPEGIDFSLLLAGPVSRAVAWIVDFAAIIALGFALEKVLSVLVAISADAAGAVGILVYFAANIGYGMFLEWFWRGQTLGKRLMRLRVMDEEGLRLRPSQVVVRNLLRFVDMLPGLYLVGGLAAVASSRGQRLGDLAAGTVVIREPRARSVDLQAALTAGKYNSMRELPHLAGRLRQRVCPAEAALALDALVRRDRLDDAARTELFAAVAEHLRAMADFPPQVTEGLSDEQYVRNVVEVLYGRN
jgi:uncharacterized RDD family membrane protein YckC